MKTSITPPKKNKLKVKNTFNFTATVSQNLVFNKSWEGRILEKGELVAVVYGHGKKQVAERTAKMIGGLSVNHAIKIN